MITVDDSFPDVVRIEPVGLCNFRCIHCPTGTEPNKRGILDRVKFDIIINQFIKNDFIPRVVVLYHGGEPLLNQEISSYIRQLKDIGVAKTMIVTNGSLLTEKISLEIINAGLDEIQISFDGETIEENNKIRRNANFEKDAFNVKKFCDLRKRYRENDLRVVISNVRICDKQKLYELKDGGSFIFKKTPTYLTLYFKGYEIDFQSFPAMVWPGYKKFGQLKKCSFTNEKPDYCDSLFETITVLSNGNVVPCCLDLKGEVVFGNVFDNNIFEIWDSQPYSNFRANFRKKIIPKFCRKCKKVSTRFLYQNNSSHIKSP